RRIAAQDVRLRGRERRVSLRGGKGVVGLQLPVNARDVEVGDVEVVARGDRPSVEQANEKVLRVWSEPGPAGEREVERFPPRRDLADQDCAGETPYLHVEPNLLEVVLDNRGTAESDSHVGDVEHRVAAAQVATREATSGVQIRSRDRVEACVVVSECRWR